MIVLGVDPGLKGALSLYGSIGNAEKRILRIIDMPTMKVGTKNELLHKNLFERVHCWHSKCGLRIEHAFIEDVHTMPKQGIVSAFNFGSQIGCLHTILKILEIPMTKVAPTKWKRICGVTSDKGTSIRRATELFPEHSKFFSRVKDDGRAEAALIAWYGYHSLAGGA